MAGINITAERIAQVNQTVSGFVSAFNNPSQSDTNKQKLLGSFDPEVRWSDHAFCITREGHEAILGLQKAFLWCNQPFEAKVKRLDVTASGAAVEMTWTGRTTNDIIRPDGQVAVKATGKDFVCHVMFLLDINDQGKIMKIGEFYNKQWDDNRSEADYSIIRGASLRQD